MGRRRTENGREDRGDGKGAEGKEWSMGMEEGTGKGTWGRPSGFAPFPEKKFLATPPPSNGT